METVQEPAPPVRLVSRRYECLIGIPMNESDAVQYLGPDGELEWGRLGSVWSTEEKKRHQEKHTIGFEVVVIVPDMERPYPMSLSKKVERYYETDKRRTLDLKAVKQIKRCIRVCKHSRLASVKELRRDHILSEFDHVKVADFNRGIVLVSEALTDDTRDDGYHDNEKRQIVYMGKLMLKFPICSETEDEFWCAFNPKKPKDPFYTIVKARLFDVCMDPDSKAGRRDGIEKGRSVWEKLIAAVIRCIKANEKTRGEEMETLQIAVDEDRCSKLRKDVSLSVLADHILRVIEMKKHGMSSFRAMNFMNETYDHAYEVFNPPKVYTEIKNFVVPDGLDTDADGELIDPKTGARVILIEETQEEEEDDDEDKSDVSLDSEDESPKKRAKKKHAVTVKSKAKDKDEDTDDEDYDPVTDKLPPIAPVVVISVTDETMPNPSSNSVPLSPLIGGAPMTEDEQKKFDEELKDLLVFLSSSEPLPTDATATADLFQ